MDAASWKPFVIFTNNEAHLNAVSAFGNTLRPMAVGYYMGGGTNAWMFDLLGKTNYRLTELTSNTTSEALDCSSVIVPGQTFNYLVVGKCGSSAVKWEFNSSADIRSHKVVDLYTVMNQLL